MSAFETKLLKDARLPVQSTVLACLDKKGRVQRKVEDDPYGACQSASLRLSKFVRLGDAEVLRIAKRKDGSFEERQMSRPSKADEIHSIVKTYGNGWQLFGPQDNRLPVLRPKGCLEFFAKTEANLAINLAGGILEGASISLHRHFNTVRLPGSALKGIASAYAYRQWVEKTMADVASAEDLAQQMGRIFGVPTGHKKVDAYLGDTESAGCISFMDAYPQGNSTLVEDILTCHHPDYYAEKKPEASDDEQKINPVPFLSLRRGVLFGFSLAPLRKASSDDLKTAQTWLIEALKELGLGAKTAAGYGWFSYNEKDSNQAIEKRKVDEALVERNRLEVEQQRLAAERKAEEAKRKAEREQVLAALSPEERLKDWVLNEWKPQNFPAKSFTDKSEEEQILIVKLMRNDEEVKACWLTIKDKAEKGKKADKKRFRSLCDDVLRSLANKNKDKIGGKLP